MRDNLETSRGDDDFEAAGPRIGDHPLKLATLDGACRSVAFVVDPDYVPTLGPAEGFAPVQLVVERWFIGRCYPRGRPSPRVAMMFRWISFVPE